MSPDEVTTILSVCSPRGLLVGGQALLLPEKRNRFGVAQAMLSLAVTRAFIRREIADRGERAALKLLERVAEIANDIASVRVFLLHGVDPLEAVPTADFRTTGTLHTRRWPQIESELRAKRESLRKSLPKSKRTAARRE